jgi:hypothetical protein
LLFPILHLLLTIFLSGYLQTLKSDNG